MIAELKDPMVTTPWSVQRFRRDTEDTFSLQLKAVEEMNGSFSFEAGQFNMLYVFGVGEVPISISGDPAKKDVLEHTTRVVGTVTKAMGSLKKGDMLGVRGPFGKSWPISDAEGKNIIIIAGGIGLAPLRPAICQILSNRRKYGRVNLLYGARTPEDILYRKDLERWRGRFDLDVLVTVDRAVRGWRGNVGVVTPLVRRAPIDRHNTVAFICGPEIMMRYAVQELTSRGIPADDIHVSMERNMKCALGHCGHCQYGPAFICKDGPILRYSQIENIFTIPEI